MNEERAHADTIHARVVAMLMFHDGMNLREPNHAEHEEIFQYALAHPEKIESIILAIGHGHTDPESVKRLADEIESHHAVLRSGVL